MLLVLLSVLLMTLDHKQQHLKTVRSVISVAVSPIQYLVNLPVDMTLWFSEGLSSRQTLMEENTRLHSQQLLLQARVQMNTALEAENRRLRKLLGSSFKVADRVLIAELYAIDLDPYKHLVRINKGSSNEVYVDQPVLDAYGVMGQVIEANPVYSSARLITDPSHLIPIQVNRNGLRTIAVGTGNTHQLELPYLPNNADILPGDLLVTSGLGQIYPTGYPVATVEKVIHNPGQSFATVTARPTAHLDRSREVLLVWSATLAPDEETTVDDEKKEKPQ